MEPAQPPATAVEPLGAMPVSHQDLHLRCGFLEQHVVVAAAAGFFPELGAHERIFVLRVADVDAVRGQRVVDEQRAVEEPVIDGNGVAAAGHRGIENDAVREVEAQRDRTILDRRRRERLRRVGADDRIVVGLAVQRRLDRVRIERQRVAHARLLGERCEVDVLGRNGAELELPMRPVLEIVDVASGDDARVRCLRKQGEACDGGTRE